MSMSRPEPMTDTQIGDVAAYMSGLGQRARAASRALARADTAAKNLALMAMAEDIDRRRADLAEANLRDLEAGAAKGLDEALLDRLELTEARVDAMIEGLRQIAALPDPVGAITDLDYRPTGIQVGRMRVPLGVVGIIYESRPNVTADAAALCLKSGNATVLRGGSEAFHSNQAIADSIRRGLESAGLPADGGPSGLLPRTGRRWAAMIAMPEYVDVIIPRGGKGLIERIGREARVPVIKHLDGICHVYIDDQADPEKAFNVALNAKTQRYGTCNTMETLLVADGIADAVLPGLGAAYREQGVELRGCPRTREILTDALAATDEDWDTEYLAPILSVRVVDGAGCGHGPHRPPQLPAYGFASLPRTTRGHGGFCARSIPAR